MEQRPVQLPALYANARAALAEIARIDEVKEIRDQALAMEVYAFQTRDEVLSQTAVEVHKRALRRMDELWEERRRAGLVAKGTRGQLSGRDASGGVSVTPPEEAAKTLEDMGIDKNLAKRMRAVGRMSADAFEASVAKAKKLAVAAVRGARDVLTAARAEYHAEKRERRDQKERELGSKIAALPQQKFGVILADPEWRFEFYSELGKTNSSADNHYPTSALEAIKARDVPSISADDCVLFLWATVPMTPHALEVMAAWGFTYKSQFVWVKDRAGTGYWNRNKHELLLLGTRGKPPAPAPGMQDESVFIAPVGKHSAKPERAYEIIEKMFPTVTKIELNARAARAGWVAWGLEAPGEDQAA